MAIMFILTELFIVGYFLNRRVHEDVETNNLSYLFINKVAESLFFGRRIQLPSCFQICLLS